MPIASRGEREDLAHYRIHDVGDEALRFAKWFSRSKFALMESFAGELDRDPAARNPDRLRRRFLEATARARRVMPVRFAVNVLLSLGSITTASALVLEQLATTVVEQLPEAAPATFTTQAAHMALLNQAVAFLAPLTLLFLLVRLAIDRYLELVAVTANYTAMQLAAAPRGRPAAGGAQGPAPQGS